MPPLMQQLMQPLPARAPCSICTKSGQPPPCTAPTCSCEYWLYCSCAATAVASTRLSSARSLLGCLAASAGEVGAGAGGADLAASADGGVAADPAPLPATAAGGWAAGSGLAEGVADRRTCK